MTWSRLNADLATFCAVANDVAQYQKVLANYSSSNFAALQTIINEVQQITFDTTFMSAVNAALAIDNYSLVTYAVQVPASVPSPYPPIPQEGSVPLVLGTNIPPSTTSFTSFQFNLTETIGGWMLDVLSNGNNNGCPWLPPRTDPDFFNFCYNDNSSQGSSFGPYTTPDGACTTTLTLSVWAPGSNGTITVTGSIPVLPAGKYAFITDINSITNPNLQPLINKYFLGEPNGSKLEAA